MEKVSQELCGEAAKSIEKRPPCSASYRNRAAFFYILIIKRRQ